MEIFAQAQALHIEGKHAEAEELYDQLLTQNHDNSGLLATMGTLYLQTGRVGLAIHCLEASRKGVKEQSEVLCNLGAAYRASGQHDKARKTFDEAIKHNPSAGVLGNYSAFFVEAGENEKCVEICNKALAMDPALAVAHWNLGLALLSDGQWDKAWDEHEWGLKTAGMRVDRQVADNVPEWDGKSPGTVHVYGEQGLGDEIMFASMLPDVLKTNKVVLECHSRLETLFRNSFPDALVFGTREAKTRPAWVDEHKIDWRISVGSLGKFYRRSRSAFPGTSYLKAEAAPKGDKFRVGISWTGGMKAGRVQKRSVPLSWWKSILNVPNVEFVSLQYTDAAEDLDVMDALGYRIKRMDAMVKANDYNETARLVKSCDLVISVCTSVIHLAGALGVPCWVMTPKHPAWRYQNTGGMPWYRSVRLYRSPDVKQDAWIPVVERIGFDLDEMVNTRYQRVA